MNEIVPTCLIHGKKWSQHRCLYCAFCYITLTPEECFIDKDGVKWDNCKPCAKEYHL